MDNYSRPNRESAAKEYRWGIAFIADGSLKVVAAYMQVFEAERLSQ